MKLTRIDMLKRAIRRLPLYSQERIFLEKELFNTEAGIRGETRLRKKFVEFYSTEPYEILWNTSLTLGKWPVQIDGLLLTSKVALIMESKNISGELHFDNDTGEFYRIDSNGVKTVMDNPAIQVEKHIRFMQNWFAEKHIHLAVDGLLVFTAVQAELCTIPHAIHTCRHHQMIEFAFRILRGYSSSPQLHKQSLKEIKHMIENENTPFHQKPIAQQYSFHPLLFEQGIHCEACETLNVLRESGAWRCLKCGNKSKSAADEAVLDYFAIFGNQAKNEAIRQFLKIDDRHLVKRLLSKNSILKHGNKRHSKYSLDAAEIIE
ncbi:nuclease-related domain-containing protein [Planococcus sp. NCCP-2050]|uniref:nuclease-related domain-containing protein n=1 Tax=Planococcus sp. NCCP-2050 TaxID=2944679 RepID=UPI002040B51C|nr:nuclease-related domain-containing protein [Planococcus sp. NCCP-2050]GKW46751.1 hypothetical protein NCCP2050_24430 [Planococcus sp. NCCP-2050]